MLTTRSWNGPPAFVQTLARRILRVGRQILVVDDSINRIEIVVFPPGSGASTTAAAPATLASIEQARAGVDADVAIRRPPLDRGATDPNVLWLFVLDGAELEPHTLSRIVDLFDADPDLDLAYGDAAGRNDSGYLGEATIAPDPAVDGPWLLPGFSPDRLADQFYLGHVVAVRPHRLLSRATADGGNAATPAFCRPSTSLSDAGVRQNDSGVIEGPWSLASVAETVVHVPEALYRPAPAVGLREPGQLARPDRAVSPDAEESDFPVVSVIIPTNGSTRDLERGPTRLVDQAVRSVLDSRYPRIEIVVVRTPGAPDDLTPRLRAIVDRHRAGGRRLTVVADERPFNFSNACNRGAIASTGHVLVFLNDDTEVIANDWLEHLVHHASRSGVGAVGARLVHEDGRVQHSGIWSRGGHPTHRYEGWPGDADGYLGALGVTQNCLAVTGACLAIERWKFELVGGFSPVFPNSYNDVDLCLKLWDRGYRTVVEPRAELYHFEASTRDPSITDDDLAALHDRWRWRLNHDPFDNPNHSAERSEEWPLPAGDRRRWAKDRPAPRRWPVEPVGRLNSG